MFCRSLFALLYFSFGHCVVCSSDFWPLCCLFFFDIRIMITPLVSSNSYHGNTSSMSRDDRNSWICPSGAGTAYKNSSIWNILVCHLHCAWCGDRRLVVANVKGYESSLHQYTKSQTKKNVVYTILYDNMILDWN